MGSVLTQRNIWCEQKTTEVAATAIAEKKMRENIMIKSKMVQAHNII